MNCCSVIFYSIYFHTFSLSDIFTIPMFTDDFIIRLIINLFTMILLIRLIYFPTYKKWDNLFPFFVLNFLVFLLAFMMFKTSVFSPKGAFGNMAAGFGSISLLAAFTLLRFRTETISVKDMTYLFVILSLGLINSIMDAGNLEIAGINAMILAAVFVADGNKLIKNQKSKVIEFNDLSNIKPQDQDKLVAQLIALTGLDIRKASVENIDFSRQTAKIRVYYY